MFKVFQLGLKQEPTNQTFVWLKTEPNLLIVGRVFVCDPHVFKTSDFEAIVLTEEHWFVAKSFMFVLNMTIARNKWLIGAIDWIDWRLLNFLRRDQLLRWIEVRLSFTKDRALGRALTGIGSRTQISLLIKYILFIGFLTFNDKTVDSNAVSLQIALMTGLVWALGTRKLFDPVVNCLVSSE